MAALVTGLNPRRPPRAAGHTGTWDLVRLVAGLKLRLLGNGLKDSNTRLVVGLIGAAAGVGASLTGVYLIALLRDAEAADARVVLVIGGSLVGLAWMVLPVLIFGVDESIDPQRFVLLPLPRRMLLAGMLAAGFVGIPAMATLAISAATVVAWSHRLLPAIYAAAGALLVTLFCVVVSRVVTTALAGVFRSRRVRDLVSMVGILVVGVVVLLQLGLPSMTRLATRDVVDRIADALAWTPFGAAWAAPYDALVGSPGRGLLRLLLLASVVLVLLVVWDVVLRRSLESGGIASGPRHTGRNGGHPAPGRRGHNGLTPRWTRGILPSSVTGAVAARTLRLWWRDPRQRVSLLIVPVILIGLLAAPPMAGFQGEVLVLGGPTVGTLVGLMMLNHTAYDGTALWTHLAVPVSGRVDRTGRALGTAVWAVPVVALAAITTCAMIGRTDLLPAAVGGSAATVLIGLSLAAVTSVVIAFPAPPASANPFITPSGGNVAVVLQQFVGGLAVGLLSLPVYLLLGLAIWWQPAIGWALLVAGPAYGYALLRVGSRIGGRYLDEQGPELLRRITPART